MTKSDFNIATKGQTINMASQRSEILLFVTHKSTLLKAKRVTFPLLYLTS